MPNWCSNFVQITHTDPAKIAALAAAVKEGKFCNHVIPVPEDLKVIAGRAGADGSPEQIELEAKERANRAKYGAANWYEFCLNRWGTKWDVEPYHPDDVVIEADGTFVSFGFDSAWSPPIGIYEYLVDDGFTVDAMYYEPGIGFCGRWNNGDDLHYDLTGMTADQVEAEVDADIDIQFNISESMREWDAENEENE